MKNNEEFKDVYEDVVIESYGIPVVITDVLVRKHKTMGRNIYINHPDSIHKIEKGLKAGVAPRGQSSYKRKLSESGEILRPLNKNIGHITNLSQDWNGRRKHFICIILSLENCIPDVHIT